MARKPKTDAQPKETPVTKTSKMLNDGGIDDLHPFILGMLQELPAPGEYWAPERRELWQTTAQHIFKLIYSDAAPAPVAVAA